MNTPIKPTKIAIHLLIPTFSLRKIIAKIDTKKGLEKKSAFAIANDINVNDI